VSSAGPLSRLAVASCNSASSTSGAACSIGSGAPSSGSLPESGTVPRSASGSGRCSGSGSPSSPRRPRARPLATGCVWRTRRSFARLRLRATVQISVFLDEPYDACTSDNISVAVFARGCCACSCLSGSCGAGTPRTRG
jgi:hypothetical protein